MNHPFESLFTIFLTMSLLSNTSCLTINSHEIRDLESNVASYFQTEASYWSATGNFSSTIYYSCNSNLVLGGYQITGNNGAFTRQYTSLPSHNQIYFSTYFWLIDMQETTDLFRIYFDGTLVRDWNTYGFSYSSFSGSSTCGASLVDYTQVYVWGQVAHSSSTLTVKVQSMYVSGTNAFSIGFRNLTLLFQTTSSTPTSSSCGFVSTSDSTNPSCLCSTNQYDPAGSSGCSSCNSACKTCAGSANTACTSCPGGSSYNGQTCAACDPSCYQCNGTTSTDCIRCVPGKYLYWNGTCLSSCSSPLVTTTEGSYQSCSLPCPLGQYYYQNGTCSTICPSPFTQSTQGDLKYCNFPCSSSTYYYSNGSCLSCTSPFTSITKGVERYCQSPCPSSSAPYYYQNSSCLSSCASPFTQSTQGVLTYCNFPCSSSTYYYSNGSCLSSCSSPFTSVTKGVEKYCQSPCPSSSAPYYYQNSSCLSPCPSPFTQSAQGVLTYCNFPCSSATYYYSNGSCLTCASPFTSISKGTERYCQSPCTTSSDYYFANNHTCSSSCNSPFTASTSGVLQSCNSPCSSIQYLYWNNTCQTSCPSPLVTTSANSNQFCNLPCAIGEYYYQNNTCSPSCPAPFTQSSQGDLLYCNSPCSTSEYYDSTTSTCLSTCDSPATIVKSGVLNLCVSSGATAFTGALGSITTGAATLGQLLRSSSASGFTVALAKIVKYVQYIPVPIPEDIRIALNPFQSDGFCIAAMFVYEMPQAWQDKITKYPLLPLFERNRNHSSYLINNWSSFSSYFFLFAMGVFFTFLEKLVRKTGKKTLILIFRRLRIMTKWNFLLFIVFNTFDDLTFFAIIQFQTLHLSTPGCIISFLVCLVGTSGAIFLLYRTFKISKEAVNLKSQVADANSSSSQPLLFYRKWEDYQTIYSGYKNDSLLKQTCLLIFSFRIIFCYLIVGLLYSYPLIQTVQLTILSIFMLVYLIKLRPINDPFGTIVALTYEGLMFGVNICLILLAVYDAMGKLTGSLQLNLSHAILKIDSIINLCSNIFAYVYLATGALTAYKASKIYGTNGKTVWLSVPLSPYSNPGMDFDDLSCVEIDATTIIRANKITRLPSKKFIAELFKATPPPPSSTKPADTILSFTSIEQEKGKSRTDLLRRRKFSDEETGVAPSLLSLSPTNVLPFSPNQDSESDGGLLTSTIHLKPSSSGTLPTMHHRNSLLSSRFDIYKKNTPDSDAPDNHTPKSKVHSPTSDTNLSVDGFSDVLQKLGNYSTTKSKTPQSRIRKTPNSRTSKRHHPHQVLSTTSKEYNRFVSLMDANIRDQIKETAEEGLTSDRFSNSGSRNLQPSIDFESPLRGNMSGPIKFQIEDISSSDYQNSVTSFSRKYTPSVRRQIGNSNSPKDSHAISPHRDFADLSLISDRPLDSTKTRKSRQKRPVQNQESLSINTPSAFNIIDFDSPKNASDDKVSHLFMPYTKTLKSTRNDLGKLSSFAKTINMTTLGDIQSQSRNE